MMSQQYCGGDKDYYHSKIKENNHRQMKQLKKRLLNYDFSLARNQDDRVNDCLEVMKISKEKRQNTELQIIELALRNFPFIQKLYDKGYHKQLKECYKVITPLHLKKVRGKVSIMTMKDALTLERERKELSLEQQQEIQASISMLQFQQDVLREQEYQKTSLSDRRDRVQVPLVIFKSNKHAIEEPIQSEASLEKSSDYSPLKFSTENSPLKLHESAQLYLGVKSVFANSFAPVGSGALSIENKEQIFESHPQLYDRSILASSEQTAKMGNLDSPIRQKIPAYFSQTESQQLQYQQQLNSNDSLPQQKQLAKLGVPELPGNLLIEDIFLPKKLFNNGTYQYSTVNNIKVGESFGEGGLILRRPRTATVICCEDTSFAVISSSDYNVIFKDIQNRKMLKKINLIAKNMDPNIPFQATCRLSLAFQKMALFLNQLVFSQGDLLAYVYFIKRGEIEISVHSKEVTKSSDPGAETYNKGDNKEKAKTSIVSVISSGSFFGEEDIIHNQTHRTYTARVKSSEAIIYRIKESEFRYLTGSSSSISEFFQKRMKIKQDWRTKQLDLVENKSKEKGAKFVAGYMKKNENQIINGVDDIDKMISFCISQSIISKREQFSLQDDTPLKIRKKQSEQHQHDTISPDQLEKLRNRRKTENISSKRPQSACEIFTTSNFIETANAINQKLVSQIDPSSTIPFQESLKMKERKINRITASSINTQKYKIEKKQLISSEVSAKKTEMIQNNLNEQSPIKDNSLTFLRNPTFKNRYLKESGSFILQSNKIANEAIKNSRPSITEIQTLLSNLVRSREQQILDASSSNNNISNQERECEIQQKLILKTREYSCNATNIINSSPERPQTARITSHSNKVSKIEQNVIRLREKAISQHQLRRPVYPFRNPQNCTLKKTHQQIPTMPFDPSNPIKINPLIPSLKLSKQSLSLPGTASNTPRVVSKDRILGSQQSITNRNSLREIEILEEGQTNKQNNSILLSLQTLSFVSPNVSHTDPQATQNEFFNHLKRSDSQSNNYTNSYFVNQLKSQPISRRSLGSIEEYTQNNSITNKESQLNENSLRLISQQTQNGKGSRIPSFNSINHFQNQTQKQESSKLVQTSQIQRLFTLRKPSKVSSQSNQNQEEKEKKLKITENNRPSTSIPSRNKI